MCVVLSDEEGLKPSLARLTFPWTSDDGRQERRERMKDRFGTGVSDSTKVTTAPTCTQTSAVIRIVSLSLSLPRWWIAICQRRLNENGFNPSEVNGMNSISRKINESLFAFDYKQLPGTVYNSCSCIDMAEKKNVNWFILFFLNGESQTKIFVFLQMDGAGAADGFVGFINYSSSLGSCEQMGIQVCQVGKNYLFNYFWKSAGQTTRTLGACSRT